MLAGSVGLSVRTGNVPDRSSCIFFWWLFSPFPHHQMSFPAAVSIPLSVSTTFPHPDFPFPSLFWSIALGNQTKPYQILCLKLEYLDSDWRCAGFSSELHVLNLCHLFWLFGRFLPLIWGSICILQGEEAIYIYMVVWLAVRMCSGSFAVDEISPAEPSIFFPLLLFGPHFCTNPWRLSNLLKPYKKSHKTDVI